MKKFILLAALLAAPAFALTCPSGFVEISDTLNDAVTGAPWNGQITITRNYNNSTARGDQQTITIGPTKDLPNLVPGVIDQCIAGGNYAIRQRGNGSGLTIAPYWTVPSTGGPYTIPDIEGSMPVTPQTSVAPSQITQAGATPGQTMGWNGSTWGPSNAGAGTITGVTANGPLTGGGASGSVSLSLPAATSSADGYLSHTDWSTFNAKQAALSGTWNQIAGTPDRATGSMTLRRMTTGDLPPLVAPAVAANLVANWTPRATPQTAEWGNLAYSPELRRLVTVADQPAGGGFGHVMTSEDGGVTWTIRTTPGDAYSWNGLVWIDSLGLYVTTPHANTVSGSMTSPDGITWTLNSSAALAGGNWDEIAWSPQLSRMCSVRGQAPSASAYSSDGVNWTSGGTVRSANYSTSVVWSSELGLFVSSGPNDPNFATSPDCITWTTQNGPAGSSVGWRRVVWAPQIGTFVATGDNGTGQKVATSPDAVNWTAHSSIDDTEHWYALAWSPQLGVFTALTGTGLDTKIMYSFDGASWTAANVPVGIPTWWSRAIWLAEYGWFVATNGGMNTSPQVMTSTPIGLSSFAPAQLAAANSSTDGYLSHVDWSAFNAKLGSTNGSSGQILTSSGSGGFGTALSTTQSGAASSVPQFDASGNLTVSGALSLNTVNVSTSGAITLFQPIATNTNMQLRLFPSGTASQTNINLYNGADVANSTRLSTMLSSSALSIALSKAGTGSAVTSMQIGESSSGGGSLANICWWFNGACAHTFTPTMATLASITDSATGAGVVRSSSGGLFSSAELSGDATTSGSNAVTVKGANGVLYSGLTTGLLKNTTTTGVPSIAVAGTDYAAPTTGSSGQFPTVNGSGGWGTSVGSTGTGNLMRSTAFAAVATTGSASDLSAGTVAAARGGAGTITGALKGNGAGTVSQAACGDLSNAAASCSTDATNATNIGSGTLGSARLATAVRAGGFSVMFRGSDATAGTTLYITVPYACTITDWVISGDSTATIKLWRVADGGTALPTVLNTLSTSGFGLSTGTRIHSSTLTDLSSTAIAAYDTFGVNLFASASTHVEFTLGCQR